MDEEFKVDLRIIQFKEEDKNQFSVGDHIQITGAVTENKGIFQHYINFLFLFFI